MKKQILKSQFVDDGAGNLVVTGAILPVNAKGGNVELAPDTTPQYYSSNESVLQIAAAGPTTFAVKYFGPGTVTLSGTGKSLSGKDVPGYIELIVVDDTEPGGGEDNEAVDLGMSLDVETTDIPE